MGWSPAPGVLPTVCNIHNFQISCDMEQARRCNPSQQKEQYLSLLIYLHLAEINETLAKDEWLCVWKVMLELCDWQQNSVHEDHPAGIPRKKELNFIHVLWIHLTAETCRNCYFCSCSDRRAVYLCQKKGERISGLWIITRSFLLSPQS
jgi:hypothetical protein